MTFETINEYFFQAVDEFRSTTYECKWDGCIHHNRYYNGDTVDTPEADSDYLHICDAALMAEQLLELCRQAKTKEAFQDYWPSPAEFVQRLIDGLTPEERAGLVR